MTLYINPHADPNVTIGLALAPDRVLTVGALRDVDHQVLAASLDLTLEQFENGIREWDQSIGLPYGVLIKGDDLKTHDFIVVNVSIYKDVEDAANIWAKRGWRVVSVNIDARQGYADQIFLERPVGISHPDD